ncbi:hypothetical protein HN018_25365 (plasmid) [Lichenicola cladoniae]|uniref:Uncharacterized protein n=1 Tax=Lichenicola cladoniae TaxID=1484109 RepID=A0A6M8HZ48_9PROT|nr:hypothetical protein [Lichenicola cladoniae]NPD66807.1 hypothetical protein [Acetobacteraceae bacterium]QKE93497.1 hypothetical protein HN018_25365 [Lichenicola cladoniae]
MLGANPISPPPARITFLTSEAQFTPKDVETEDDQDKLMFGVGVGVGVRIDPVPLFAAFDRVKTGPPGLAYVLRDPHVPWPTQLRPKPLP